jgi:hypothetical protein
MTFSSRGVAVRFTTPMLSGTRVRRSMHEDVELVVPNLSGGRGVNVMRWSGVLALCSPTLHDTLVIRRCCRLAAVEPASIRDTVLEVAREGHAGRQAATAAEAAIAHDHSQRLLARFLLVVGLVELLDRGGQTIASPPEWTVELSRRASAVLHRIAPSLGRPAGQLANDLTAIGDLFAPAGVGAGDRDARIPRLLTRMEDTRADLSRWLDADPRNDICGLGRAVMAALWGACESGEALLEQTRSALTDPAALLKRWITGPNLVLAQATRCDWLLDGWERVSLLWLSASTSASRRAALLEMAPLVPELPREVMEWTDTAIPGEAMEQACRVTSKRDGWRIGAAGFALIERNEKLLAMSI